jgi:selenide,water dikinase
LETIIDSIAQSRNSSVIVGPGDDAGIYLLSDNQAIAETVDIITPVVDNPFLFGSISAANSLSDIYAMGGKPLTALALVGFPSCDFEIRIVKEILSGALDTLDKAGVVLMGGHSFDDPEPKFGLSVTGTVERERILRQKGAVPGDLLILTKPLGNGILTTALKGGKLTENDMREAIEWMMKLNGNAARRAVQSGATAATDVTGFGLLGHAYTMVKGTYVDFILHWKHIPILPHTLGMLDAGMVPLGAYNNLKFLEGKVELSGRLTEEKQLVLSDPQTSGGLLITLPEDRLAEFQDDKEPFHIIGRAEKGTGKIIVDA